MMTVAQVDVLRAAVELESIVLWWPRRSPDVGRVVKVPTEKIDPDETGSPTFTAVLIGGKRVALDDADPDDFLLAVNLFGK